MVGRRVVVVSAWTWLVVLGSALPAMAQVGAATLTGVVSDPSGAGVPGATITITSTATNRMRVVASSSDGGYAVTGLAPGAYGVRVDLSGFRSVERTGIRVATGEAVRLDVRLEVASVAEAVTVVGDASQ